MICRICLTPLGGKIVVLVTDTTETEFSACDPCMKTCEIELAALRKIFDALIDGKIDRKIANDVLIAYQQSHVVVH